MYHLWVRSDTFLNLKARFLEAKIKKLFHALFELSKHFMEALVVLKRLSIYLEIIKMIFSSPYMLNIRILAGKGFENGNFGLSMDGLS